LPKKKRKLDSKQLSREKRALTAEADELESDEEQGKEEFVRENP
jgi:hypothetical protein